MKIFDCEVKVWISIQIVSSVQGVMLVFCGNSGDSLQRVCSFDQNSQEYLNFTFKINIPTVYAPASTSEVVIFKLESRIIPKIILNQLDPNSCR